MPLLDDHHHEVAFKNMKNQSTYLDSEPLQVLIYVKELCSLDNMHENNRKPKDLKSGEDLLALNFLKLVNLVSHLVGSILVLLSQCGNLGLMLECGLLKVSSKLQKLLLAFLVELNLGGRRTTSLVKTLAEFFEFTRDFCSLFLNLEGLGYRRMSGSRGYLRTHECKNSLGTFRT